MLQVNGFKIKWDHFRGKNKVGTKRIGTFCTISNDDDVLLSLGGCVCSINDNFNRDYGRKLSLSRALKNFEKEEREKIWEAYRTMTKIPRWRIN